MTLTLQQTIIGESIHLLCPELGIEITAPTHEQAGREMWRAMKLAESTDKAWLLDGYLSGA